jgi:hypothetical protein
VKKDLVDKVGRLYEESLIWITACGLELYDINRGNVDLVSQGAQALNVTHIPGVGMLYPKWSVRMMSVKTDCDMCDRYIQLRVLAYAKL